VASRFAVATAVVAASVLLASSALADGDPASDVLVSSNTFLPSPPAAPAAVAQLNQAVESVVNRGDRVKVAVIASRNDLGAIPSLFGKPQAYAKFLGLELSQLYSGALLIVMPQGFGFYEAGKPTSRAAGVLQRVSISGKSATELTRSAATAVTGLERAGTLHFTDLRPPQVYVIAAAGRRGQPLKLRYFGLDDSNEATVAASVTRGTVVLASFRSSLETVMPSLVSSFTWNVPRGIHRGKATFCARATDAAGHRSAKSCTTITIA
jgi:hypothetical protein